MDDLSNHSTKFNLNGIVVFQLDEQLFCVDLDLVFAIINPSDFPQNINNSFLVKSNLDIDNFSIPIIDLHAYFGLKHQKITKSSRFICIEKNNHTFAFTADKVQELITINEDMKNNFDFLSTEEKYVSTKIRYSNTVLNLIDFNAIINEEFIHH